MFEAIFLELVKARISRGGEITEEVLADLARQAELIEAHCTSVLAARQKQKQK